MNRRRTGDRHKGEEKAGTGGWGDGERSRRKIESAKDEEITREKGRGGREKDGRRRRVGKDERNGAGGEEGGGKKRERGRETRKATDG